ncbi:unnamed protein product [Oikopleura dioica]|uniref:Uncharacterized protein n=1 Tax=Oikopleura dioica TaxID=34765 RepID=E4YQG1_OIKDI|nr:unnamed protein product [Oikopleura dioica]
MGGSSSKKTKSKAKNEEMEQPPAPGKIQKEQPEVTVNERSVDNSDYEKQVQKDFYKKSPKFKKDFAKKGQARKTPAFPTAIEVSTENEFSWAADGSLDSLDERTNSSGFLSPPSG